MPEENDTINHQTYVMRFNFGIHRLILNFDIIAIVKAYGRKIIGNNDSLMTSDDDLQLTNYSKITKGTFARVLNQWGEENAVTKKAMLDLLNIMHNGFGNFVRLPVKLLSNEEGNDDDEDDKSTQSKALLKTKSVQSTLEDYDHSISRFFAFNQCQKDCSVFIGDNHDSYQCKICSLFRFRPCVRMNCPTKGKRDCQHLLQDGVPMKQFFYRPLILLILDLVRTKWFVKALNYRRKDFREYYNGDTNIADGKVAEENLNEMKSHFELWKRRNPKKTNLESVNILLSEFYDGAQMFKRRTKDFNCLITGILNLPPTYRGKEGISNFISAVYEGKHKFAEQALFSEMYVEELQTLLKGIEFEFEGKLYFIQARLVLHIMDTKAAEGVYQLQNCANNTNGCPCCELIYGIHEGSKCIYPGHRYTLPLDHYLRPIGQSKKCCPSSFYSKNLWFAMESFSAEKDAVRSVHEDSKRQRMDEEYCLPCDGDRVRQQFFKDTYTSTNSDSNLRWFHTGDFNLEAIRNPASGLKRILYYRHYDFREYQPYKRYPYDSHMRDALHAEALILADQNSKSSKKKTSIAVNGIKGVWPFGRYQIADISRHSGPPAIHAMTGCIRMLLDIMLGEYVLKDSKSKKGVPIEVEGESIDLNCDNIDIAGSEDEDEDEESSEDEEERCVDTAPKAEPLYYKPDYRPSNAPGKSSYTASKLDVSRINYWLRCVLLPKGLNDDSWSIRLDSIGSLKMNQKLKIISCYWDLICLACPSIHLSYKLFYRMFAADLMQMQSLYFTHDDVDHLQNCILESVSSWEGVLPPKTMHYKVHQLVDLPSMFKNFGTLFNFSEFSGERMIGVIKNLKLLSNTGGCSFGNTIMRKQVRRELRKMNDFYSRPVNESDRSAPNGKHISIQDGELLFNDFPFSLNGKKTNKVNLEFFEIEHLAELLLFEIEKRFSFDKEKCKAQSILYRLLKSPKKAGSYVQILHGAIYNKENVHTPEEISVFKSLMQGEKIFHDRACIYGLDFGSRGSINREISPAVVHSWGVQRGQKNSYDVRRGGKTLKWYDKASYSSWCMYRGYEDKIKFGQLNGFFLIQIGDPGIDGLLVASVTSRRFYTTEHVHFVDEYNSLDPRQNFVSLQDICPTLIGIVPFHGRTKEQLKAISLNPNVYASIDKIFNPAHICENKENISCYGMILLHPERMQCQPIRRPFHAFY